ncbi:MAG: LamG domain-containing protein, partial [Gammaproteobacteria bacterium]|nr:LamG domain-containing protein [Gammaproteobacteria bacterium]
PDDDNIGSLFSSNDEIRIGAGWSGGNRLDGVVDDVRFYDRALSAAEISGLYTAGTGGGGGGGGGSGTYRDEFNAKSYSGSDGTLTWSTDWLEIGESDGATSGDEQVRSDSGFNYVLRVRDNDNGGEGVQREADLSDCSDADLTFDYRRKSFDNSNDYVTVDVSANGGSSWTELDRLAGPANESTYQSASYDISSAMAANTRIRFLTSSTLGGSDELFVENVEISCL